MPRIARLMRTSEQTVYHVMSGTALDGFPLKDVEQDYLVNFFRQKYGTLFEFVKEIKMGFSRFYNRRGFFKGERFKSVMIEKVEIKKKGGKAPLTISRFP